MKRFLQKIKNSWALAVKAGATLGSKATLFLVAFRIPLYNRLGLTNTSYTAWIGNAHAKTKVYFDGTYDELLLLSEIFVNEQYAVPAHARECKTIVDLGANSGLSAIYFAMQCPQAAVYAYEANPFLFKQLKQNLAGVSRIHVYNAAVQAHDAESVAFFVNPKKSIASSLTERDASMQKVSVPGVSLNTIITNVGDSIDILKIDVEGAEFEIFESLTNGERVRYIVGELHEDIAGKPAASIITKLARTHEVKTTMAGHTYRLLLYATAH